MMKARSMIPNIPTQPAHYFPHAQAILEEKANKNSDTGAPASATTAHTQCSGS